MILHPIKLGLRSHRWAKTLLFNFLVIAHESLEHEAPEAESGTYIGTWTIESRYTLIEEDFLAAKINKPDFYTKSANLEVIPGVGGYVAIDIPPSYADNAELVVSVSSLNNASISFTHGDEWFTPTFELCGDYLLGPRLNGGVSAVLVRRVNQIQTAAAVISIVERQALYDAKKAIVIDNYKFDYAQWPPKADQFFRTVEDGGIGRSQRLMCHTEQCTADELLEKLMHHQRFPKPKLKYIVFFMPRSGATLFAQALAKSQIFGNPQEFFLPSFYHAYSRIMGCANPHEYIARIERVFQSRQGVFGMRVDWDRFNLYWKYYLEAPLDGYIKFYLDRKDFLAHFVSQFFASISHIWFDIKGEETPEHDLLEHITPENVASVFSFLLNHKLGWDEYLQGRNDVVRIYYEDIMSKLGLKAIVADLLPQVDLWSEVQKNIASGAYYEDTFFVASSSASKKDAGKCVLALIESDERMTLSTDGKSCTIPRFLAPYAEQIKRAVERNIDLYPFVTGA